MSARKRPEPRYCFELYEVLLCCCLVGLLIGALVGLLTGALGVAEQARHSQEVRR